MRVEEEAGRARDQLAATQTDIVAAVEMVTRVDSALQGISGGVGEVHRLLGGIADDNQAQCDAIGEISSGILQMDQATEQNAAMVEETSAASARLRDEAMALSRQTGRFRIAEAGEARRVALAS
jgi:methyl-accepting chemotaxis protein